LWLNLCLSIELYHPGSYKSFEGDYRLTAASDFELLVPSIMRGIKQADQRYVDLRCRALAS
jgi:hypothetical protein